MAIGVAVLIAIVVASVIAKSTGKASVFAGGRLTKDEWKAKLKQIPGLTLAGGTEISVDVTLTPDAFKKVMGNPVRTQTVGDNAYWYYSCKDGEIQLVTNVMLLEPPYFTMNGCQVNDY